MKPRIFPILMLTGLLGSAAQASDGVFEINADCAVFGCFDGDTAGLPVQITNPGSYRLTGNLTTGSASQTLIEITADSVALDLNGFSILGPVSCSGTSTSCSSSGTGIGIDGDGREDLQIRNGTIRGMGNDGVVVGRGPLLENLVVAENADDGIVALAPGGVLRRIVARENGGNGVSLGFASSYLMDSTAYNNGEDGVFGGFCGNVLMSGNTGNACVAIAPNQCSTPTDCD
jgi:hypothetical protein